MDPEDVINLFDSCWFKYEILKGNTQYLKVNKPSSPSAPRFSSLRSILVRSQSEDMGSFNYGSFSPNSVLFTPQLKSIPSAKSDFKAQEQEQVQKAETDPKEQADHEVILQERKKKSRRRHGRGHGHGHGHGVSKSLSELEFEELKGFMDLGFVFSEQDKEDSSLVEIIPGLQRLGKGRERENDDDDDDDKKSCSSTGTARRPYLSEAWEDLDSKVNKKQQTPAMTMNWEIPAVKSEIDMKDNLKLWAHTVASIVK